MKRCDLPTVLVLVLVLVLGKSGRTLFGLASRGGKSVGLD